MNIDFHYYGTYVAACLAGYSKDEAQIIAHAAQYVDDSTDGKHRLIAKGENGIDIQPIPTCHEKAELGWNLITPKGFISPSSSDLRKVWVLFHFLPGNYKLKEKYQGATSRTTWNYDDQAEWEFNLLCLPDSPLSIEMINNIINKHKGQPYELHLIGVRMHVLADTAAHAYYAGTPAWHVNNVDSDVYYFTDNREWKKVPFGVSNEWCTPNFPTLAFDSDFYLGHGRMGCVPDYPWIKYKYIPQWREKADEDKELIKDNPDEYLKIFKKMVTALKCIRNQKIFDPNDLEPIDQKYIDVINKILRTKHDFGLSDSGDQIRCAAWKKAISDGSLSPLVTMPEEYNPDIWLNIAKHHQPINETDYYKFNQAAIIHLDSFKTFPGALTKDWTKIIPVGLFLMFYKNDGSAAVGCIDDTGQLIGTQNIFPGTLLL